MSVHFKDFMHEMALSTSIKVNKCMKLLFSIKIMGKAKGCRRRERRTKGDF